MNPVDAAAPSTRSPSAEARQAAIDAMLARDAIQQVLARYARAIDRADGPLLKACYFEDAIEEHGSSFSGPAHQYVDLAMPKVRTMGVMQHLLGNSHVELQGDVAYVETYIWTFARFTKDGRDWDTFTGGRLMDRFERRDGEWKIAHRRTIFDWNRDTPASEGWCLGYMNPAAPGFRRGRKDAQDPSYEPF
jgi:ketosteroid isomerase-like protein